MKETTPVSNRQKSAKGTHPAKARYWNRNRLTHNKVRNIMRNKGCDKTTAYNIFVNGVPSHPKTKPDHQKNITVRVTLTDKSGRTVMTQPVGGRKKRYKGEL